jgi:hypothetical protein
MQFSLFSGSTVSKWPHTGKYKISAVLKTILKLQVLPQISGVLKTVTETKDFGIVFSTVL